MFTHTKFKMDARWNTNLNKKGKVMELIEKNILDIFKLCSTQYLPKTDITAFGCLKDKEQTVHSQWFREIRYL